jgi:hypothetical protein
VAKFPEVTLTKEEGPKKILSVSPKRIDRRYAIQRKDYECGDDSATDFAYVLALLRRGFGQDEITERLLDERSDWTHHKGERRQNAYIERTIKRAVEIINE